MLDLNTGASRAQIWSTLVWLWPRLAHIGREVVQISQEESNLGSRGNFWARLHKIIGNNFPFRDARRASFPQLLGGVIISATAADAACFRLTTGILV